MMFWEWELVLPTSLLSSRSSKNLCLCCNHRLCHQHIINFTFPATNILNFAITITDLINSGEVATELGCVLALKKIGRLTGELFNRLDILDPTWTEDEGFEWKEIFPHKLLDSFRLSERRLPQAQYFQHSAFLSETWYLTIKPAQINSQLIFFSKQEGIKVSRQNMICRRGLELWLDALRPLIKDSLSWYLTFHSHT